MRWQGCFVCAILLGAAQMHCLGGDLEYGVFGAIPNRMSVRVAVADGIASRIVSEENCRIAVEDLCRKNGIEIVKSHEEGGPVSPQLLIGVIAISAPGSEKVVVGVRLGLFAPAEVEGVEVYAGIYGARQMVAQEDGQTAEALAGHLVFNLVDDFVSTFKEHRGSSQTQFSDQGGQKDMSRPGIVNIINFFCVAGCLVPVLWLAYRVGRIRERKATNELLPATNNSDRSNDDR